MNEDNYTRTATTVSLLNYHFVFCPRYRRKIFNIPGVEERFKELAFAACDKHGIEILAMECHVDHVHMFVRCLPSQSPADVMQWVKGSTSKVLRNEFPKLSKMSSFWTRSYFVSTAGSVSSDTIQKYVETQKTRPIQDRRKKRKQPSEDESGNSREADASKHTEADDAKK